MRKIIFLLVLVFSFNNLKAQELDCTITINHDQIRTSNNQIFQTLEKAIFDYMNKTKWTDKRFKKQEKIKCAMTFNITEQPDTDHFKGSLQIQVLRPVFNSTYLSPILNLSDNDLSFRYEEYQPLIYNDNVFQANLTSLLHYYANVILGIDADTFEYKGGEEYYKKAEVIILVAQQSGFVGWKKIDGPNTRFHFINENLNEIYKDFRFAMYRYHISGLDIMLDDKTKAKNNIAEAITNLQRIYSKRPRSYLLRVFLDTKEEEIVSIFKDGPKTDTRGLKEMLARVYGARNNSWEKIQ